MFQISQLELFQVAVSMPDRKDSFYIDHMMVVYNLVHSQVHTTNKLFVKHVDISDTSLVKVFR